MLKKYIALFTIMMLLLSYSASAHFITNTDNSRYYNYMLIDMPVEASEGVEVSKIFYSKCQLARSAMFTGKGQSISFKINLEEKGNYLMYFLAKLSAETAIFIDDVQVGPNLVARKSAWNRYVVGTYECTEPGVKTLRIENLSDATVEMYYMGMMLMHGDIYYYTAPEIENSIMLSEPESSSYTMKTGNFYNFIQFTPDAISSTPHASVAQKASFSFEIEVKEAGIYNLTGRFYNYPTVRGRYNLYVNDQLALENYVLGLNTTEKHDQQNMTKIGTVELHEGKNMITMQCAGAESATNVVYDFGIFALMAEKK